MLAGSPCFGGGEKEGGVGCMQEHSDYICTGPFLPSTNGNPLGTTPKLPYIVWLLLSQMQWVSLLFFIKGRRGVVSSLQDDLLASAVDPYRSTRFMRLGEKSTSEFPSQLANNF